MHLLLGLIVSTINVGGEAILRAGASRKDVFERLRTHGWSNVSHDVIDAAVACAPTARPYDGPSGPTEEVLALGESPLGLFYHFLPKSLWRHIAKESNKYWAQQLDATVARRLERPACRLTEAQVRSQAYGTYSLY